MCQLVVIAGLLWSSPVLSAPVKPVVTITYDQDFNGTGRDGRPVVGTPVAKPVLVPGKFGKALKSGPTTGYVHYPSKGILNTKSGPVEMWVSPVDWSPMTANFITYSLKPKARDFSGYISIRL